MAAASVLIPLSVINQNGGVLPPSALSQQTPRHGRSRGMSVNGKSAGGKGYRVVENADATVAKAVAFVLKRAVSNLVRLIARCPSQLTVRLTRRNSLSNQE